MESAVNYRWLFADIFHHVDLAAGGPVRSVKVVAQHPKRRPETLTVRDLDPSLETSIRLSEFCLSEQSRRSIVASYAIGTLESFLQRLNHQRAAFKIGIGCAARVDLDCVRIIKKQTYIKR